MTYNDEGIRTRYLQQEILAAPREKLFLLTYEIAVGACRKACLAIESGDTETSNEELQRAQRAVRELHFALRSDQDEELFESLGKVYDHLYLQLVEANVNKDAGIVRSVAAILEDLQQTWNRALEELRDEEGSLTDEERQKLSYVPASVPVGGGLNISG